MMRKINYRKLVRTILKQRLVLMLAAASILYCLSVYKAIGRVDVVHKRNIAIEKEKSHYENGESANAPLNPDDILDGQIDMHFNEVDRRAPGVGDLIPQRKVYLYDPFKPMNRGKKKTTPRPKPKKEVFDRKRNLRKPDRERRNNNLLMKDSKLGEKEKKEDFPVDQGIEVDKNQVYKNVELPPFVDFAKPGDPGEMGKAYKIDSNSLSSEEKVVKKADYEKHFFDEWVSRRISVHRALDDRLPTGCLNQNLKGLPEASVVMVFRNEAWTTLLRSIHSILDRTPDNLLKEIILLDDFSDMDHLGIPLEAYVKSYPKIRLIRATLRIGLIRARNLGVKLARSDIIIFLDSHIECFRGWFEPLVQAIQSNPKTVAYPHIEYISPATFACSLSGHVNVVGGFYLHTLSFAWLYGRKLKVTTRTENHPSPTMPGGLYAVSKDWFNTLGGYDPGLRLWGGENIEMSFKAWMCGGSVILVSCSRVGHIFRQKNPNLVSGRQTHANSVRVAEVWMDSYKHFFYERIGYGTGHFGDVTSRRDLRRSLSCHSFSWYLDNVYPEMKEEMNPQNVFSGRIVHNRTRTCLDRISKPRILRCSDYRQYQLWHLTSKGFLESGDGILTVRFSKSDNRSHFGFSKKSFFPAGVSTSWIYKDSRLVLNSTNLCLSSVHGTSTLTLSTCTDSANQKWKMDTREMLQEVMKRKNRVIDWSE